MIRVASRWAFACCLLIQGPAFANSADTDWLLEEIRSQLASMKTIKDCLDSTHCVSQDEHLARDLLSTQSYPAPFAAKQFPTQERPWFIDVAGDSTPKPWRDYTYRSTRLMQTVRSLERVKLATFWERNDMELFPTQKITLQSKRITRPSTFIN